MTTESTRIKRLKITSVLPTATNAIGTINLVVIGSDKELVFNYHVPANLSGLLIKAIDAGFVTRFTTVSSGIKEVDVLVAKLEAEVELLTAGTFTSKGSAPKTVFADIIYAYGLSELANVSNVEVALVYQAKWDALTKEEKQALRSSSKVKRQLNNIENARLDAEEAAQAQVDLAEAIAAE